MTMLLDLPPHIASRVEADAAAQGKDAADVVRAALADWYADEENDANDIEGNLPDDIYQTHPLPPLLTEPLSEALRAGFADIDAGRVTDGETFLAELRDYVRRK